MSDYRISAEVDANVEGFTSGMDKASEGIAKFLEGVGGFEVSAIAINQSLELLEKGFDLFKDVAVETVKAYTESEAAGIRLNAILAATGGVAGQTAEDLENMARAMAGKTIFDDEAMKSAEARMLTFKNVTGDTFTQAIRLSTDLASAFGTDLTTASNTLGRALDDPVAGLTALHRMGITFTEDQKAQIKAFQDAGETAKAQGVILDVLKGKIGGVGEALRNSAGGDLTKFSQSVEDAQKLLGKFIAEGIDPFVKIATSMIVAFIDTDTASQKLVRTLQENITKNEELAGQATAIIGPIDKKNESEKLTLDQYTKLVAIYPELKGKIDAYSTSLIEASKAAKDQEDRAKALAVATLEEAVAFAKASQARAGDDIGAYSTRTKVAFDRTTDLNKAIQEQYENQKKLQAIINADSTSLRADDAARQIASEQAYIEKLRVTIGLEGNLATLKQTGSLEEKKIDQGRIASGKAVTEALSAQSIIQLEIDTARVKEKLSRDKAADADEKKEFKATLDYMATVDKQFEDNAQARRDADVAAQKAADEAKAASAKMLTEEITATTQTMISGPFQALGDALVKGSAIWEAFGKSVVHSFGTIVKGLGDKLTAMAAADFVLGLAAASNPITAVTAPGFFAQSGIEAGGATAAYTTAGVLSAFEDGTSYSPAGYAIVGEKGPEMVKLPQGASVATAQDTPGKLGGNHTFVFNSPTAMNPNQQQAAFERMAKGLRFKGVLI